MSNLDQELDLLINGIKNITVVEEAVEMSTAEQIRTLVDSAIQAALAVQRQTFEQQLKVIENRFNDFTVSTPEVETYKEISIIPGVKCDESLDIIKSLPDFEGKHETYVSWRQAAHTAYKIFEEYDGSSRHYQAVAIIRNKIKGSADMTLSSFNTALNFKAIIARLDFTYSDKRPIYLIEQELSTLRQGNLTLLEFYDEVERKLTLLTNKTLMTHDKTIAASLNEKYRMDALRVFISGTKKELSNVLFSARPTDLPSALALAQEVESNRERYLFASNFARSREDKGKQRSDQAAPGTSPAEPQTNKNPHFTRKHKFDNRKSQTQSPVEPMDVDDSARFKQSTKYRNQYSDIPSPNGQTVKRPNSGTARFTGTKHQRVNLLTNNDQKSEQDYQTLADNEASDNDVDAADEFDQINFLEVAPCYRS